MPWNNNNKTPQVQTPKVATPKVPTPKPASTAKPVANPATTPTGHHHKADKSHSWHLSMKAPAKTAQHGAKPATGLRQTTKDIVVASKIHKASKK